MDDYLTVHEASKILKIKPGALLKRLQRGHAKGHKRGWVWFIHKDEVSRLKGKQS